ncbi:MAG TPA: methyltransferase domain-containing protein [Polyangiaceae bacterium]|nr:methyltransferase domain-containing protein [Polyangiaceae bacterium]
MSDARNRADALRTYYDEFSHRYEAERRPNRPDGYHALLDDLEVELVQRYGGGLDVLECGAGTGLLLERIAAFARSAKGIDVSNGMLEKARKRGLDVSEATITAIPFADGSFDVTCAFKVLAHVPEIGQALAEMSRVTRRGGVVLAEFYNPLSLRGLVKLIGPTGRISHATRESDVFTRFDAPWVVPRLLPPSLSLETARGVRIVTPAAGLMRVPGLRGAFRALERRLADTRAAFFAGFYIAVLRKH